MKLYKLTDFLLSADNVGETFRGTGTNFEAGWYNLLFLTSASFSSAKKMYILYVHK